MPGCATIEEFLASTAAMLGRQPWLTTTLGILYDVTLVPQDEEWLVRDRNGAGLPLVRRNHWRMLAVTGGQPCDFVGEWDGRWLRPLGLLVSGRYRVV